MVGFLSFTEDFLYTSLKHQGARGYRRDTEKRCWSCRDIFFVISVANEHFTSINLCCVSNYWRDLLAGTQAQKPPCLSSSCLRRLEGWYEIRKAADTDPNSRVQVSPSKFLSFFPHQQLWRVQVTHFVAFFCRYCSVQGRLFPDCRCASVHFRASAVAETVLKCIEANFQIGVDHLVVPTILQKGNGFFLGKPMVVFASIFE